MNQLKKLKGKLFLPLCPLLLATVLAGCGKAEQSLDAPTNPDTQDDANADAVGDIVEDSDPEENGDTETGADSEPEEESMPELTEEEIAALKYIEKIGVEDFYGDKSVYDAYAPKESSNEDGYVFYYEHGLTYSASACNFDSLPILYDYMDGVIEYDMEDWETEGSGYTNVQLGEILQNNEDRYQFATAQKEDIYGTPFVVNKVFYLDVQDNDAGILWELELSEMNVDEETDLVIDEISRCYRVNLDAIKSNGAWLADDAKRAEQQQDVYEPREDDNVLEKVDGYQYMGLTTLTVNEGAAQCPVMVPMGWQTYIKDNTAMSTLHGVKVYGAIDMLIMKDFLVSVKTDADGSYKSYHDDTERYRKVKLGEIYPIAGYDMASYVVLTYDEKDYLTKEFLPQTEVKCYIRINEDYVLEYTITLSPDEYDDSTNVVIKELEAAYGIDLSEYYYKN
ncbi:MAG: hypothetical protein J1F41_08660 [Lachnospiraceae bacterium]|nr:hypothetical protein [Lachnospiraceae bacterium]